MTADKLLSGFIDRKALANALNVSARTIARYENQADGLPSVVIGGRKLYRLDSVRSWIEAREHHPNQRRNKR